MAEVELEARARLFKALGHPTRLLIVNLVRAKERHGEELAALLRLSAATVSHHLGLLAEAGLLVSRKAQYYHLYSLRPGVLDRTLAQLIALPPQALAQTNEDAYRTKVLRAFFEHGRLKRVPTQLKKRRIVLERLAEAFELGRSYQEREVNLLLAEFHDDFATLRRELVGHGLMHREGGVYRLAMNPARPVTAG